MKTPETKQEKIEFPEKIPIIKVSKYLLREWNPNDIPFSYAYLTNPETIQDTSFNIKNMEDMKKRIGEHKQHFKEKTRLGWVIEDTETGKTIGEISCFDIDNKQAEGEIGYFLGKEYWGQGIMSQILEAVLDYLFNVLKIHTLKAVVIKENTGSCRLLEKNGFEKVDLLKQYKFCRDRYRDFFLFRKVTDS